MHSREPCGPRRRTRSTACFSGGNPVTRAFAPRNYANSRGISPLTGYVRETTPSAEGEVAEVVNTDALGSVPESAAAGATSARCAGPRRRSLPLLMGGVLWHLAEPMSKWPLSGKRGCCRPRSRSRGWRTERAPPARLSGGARWSRLVSRRHVPTPAVVGGCRSLTWPSRLDVKHSVRRHSGDSGSQNLIWPSRLEVISLRSSGACATKPTGARWSSYDAIRLPSLGSTSRRWFFVTNVQREPSLFSATVWPRSSETVNNPLHVPSCRSHRRTVPSTPVEMARAAQ